MSGPDGRGVEADRREPGEFRPDLDLLTRPALVGPNDAARDRLRTWRDGLAAMAWIARAWLEPAGGEARWEQRAGRESLADESRSESSRGGRRERPDERGGSAGRRPSQGQTRTTGTGH